MCTCGGFGTCEECQTEMQYMQQEWTKYDEMMSYYEEWGWFENIYPEWCVIKEVNNV